MLSARRWPTPITPRAVREGDRRERLSRIPRARREGRRAAGLLERRDHLPPARRARAGVGDVELRGAGGQRATRTSPSCAARRRTSSSARARSRSTSRCCTSSGAVGDAGRARGALTGGRACRGSIPASACAARATAWPSTCRTSIDVGHEAHFAQVTRELPAAICATGKLPEWEVPNMLMKYFTIMQAYEMSRAAAPAARAWQRDEHTLTRLDTSGKPVWKLSLDPSAGKPFFHPVTVGGGPSLTARSPEDHPWHYGVWFSWKYINGVNYWEEDRTTGKPAGATRWKVASLDPRPDGSATIQLDVSYVHPSGRVDLTEKRTLEVSAPAADGSYSIDWRARLHGGRARRPARPHADAGRAQRTGQRRLRRHERALRARAPRDGLSVHRGSDHGVRVGSRAPRGAGHRRESRARTASPSAASRWSATPPTPASTPRGTWSTARRCASHAQSFLAPKPMQIAPGGKLKLHYKIAVRRDPWTPDTLTRLVRSEGDRT